MISFYDDQVTFDANSSTNAIVTFEPFTLRSRRLSQLTISLVQTWSSSPPTQPWISRYPSKATS
jgi:hypothetical protein